MFHRSRGERLSLLITDVSIFWRQNLSQATQPLSSDLPADLLNPNWHLFICFVVDWMLLSKISCGVSVRNEFPTSHFVPLIQSRSHASHFFHRRKRYEPNLLPYSCHPMPYLDFLCNAISKPKKFLLYFIPKVFVKSNFLSNELDFGEHVYRTHCMYIYNHRTLENV